MARLSFRRRSHQLDRAKAAYEQGVINCNLAKNSVNDTGVKSAYASLVQAKANLEDLKNPSERTLLTAKVQLDQAKVDLEDASRISKTPRSSRRLTVS